MLLTSWLSSLVKSYTNTKLHRARRMRTPECRQTSTQAEVLEHRLMPIAGPIVNISGGGEISESSSVGNVASFTVERTDPVGGFNSPLTVSLTIGGTATAGTSTAGDYSISGASRSNGILTITIPAHQSSASFSVQANSDGVSDDREQATFTVRPGGSYGVLSDGSASSSVVIRDAAASGGYQPIISIVAQQPSVSEGAPDGETADFVVSSSSNSSQVVHVTLAVSGSATRGSTSDYSLLVNGAYYGSGTIELYLAPNSSATISVDPRNDSTDEPNEGVNLSINTSASYDIGQKTASIVIVDDDDVPNATVTLSVPDASASENGDAGQFTFTRSGSTAEVQNVYFSFGTVSNPATLNVDYTLTNVRQGGLLWYAQIPKGKSSVDVNVLPLADLLGSETTERVRIELAVPPVGDTPYDFGATTAGTVSISNIAALQASFAISGQDLSASEAVVGGIDNGRLKVVLNYPAPTNDFSVSYQVTGTATSGVDYQGLSGSVVFKQGDTEAYIDVSPYWDTFSESDETVIVKLQAGATFSTSSSSDTQTVTIHNAGSSAVWFDSSTYTAAEPSSGGSPTAATITLRRSGNTTVAQTVRILYAGTAQKDVDYSVTSADVTFAAGMSTATITLTPSFDENYTENSPSEYALLTAQVFDGCGYVIDTASGHSGATSVTISDATKPTLTLSVEDSGAVEPTGGTSNTGSFLLTRNGNLSQPLQVSFGIGGTAIGNGTDYTLSFQRPGGTPATSWTSSGGTFDAGDAYVRVILTPVQDFNDSEVQETAVMNVYASGSRYTVASPSTGTVTIDNAAAPHISFTVDDSAAAEDSTSGPPDKGKFIIHRDGNLATSVTVNYSILTGSGKATFGSSASNSDGDYHILVDETQAILSGATGTLTFAANQDTLTLYVIPHQDSTTESSEPVSFSITPTSGALYQISPGSGTVNIADSIAKTVTISVIDASAAEYGPGGDPDPGLFRFTRTGSTVSSLTVAFSLTGSSELNDFSSVYAATGAALVLNNGTGNYVTIPAGNSFVDVRIDPLGDNRDAEPTETVIFTVKSGTGYTVGSADSGSVAIANLPKQTVVLTVDGTTAQEYGSSGAPVSRTFTLTRSGPAGLINDPLTVAYVMTGTATNDVDYNGLYTGGNGTVTFAAHQTSLTITLTPKRDTLDEDDETAILTLVNLPNVSLYQLDYDTPSSFQKQVTIIDRVVTTVTVAATDANATEWSNPSAAADNGQFTITRAGGDLTLALDVFFTLEGTAKNGEDYTTVPLKVSFLANQTSAVVDIKPFRDASATEGDETVLLKLAADPNYGLGATAQATVTIADASAAQSPTVQVSSYITNQDNTCGCSGEYLKPGDGVTIGTLTIDYATGSVIFTPATNSGVSNGDAAYFPTSMGRDNPHPVFTVSVTIPEGAPVPRYLDAQLKLGGINTSTTTFEMPAGAVAGTTYQFALQTDASALSTGQYDYSVNVIGRYDTGGSGTDASALGQASGSTPLINLSNSVYGRSWGLPGLSQLLPSTVDGQSGYTLFRGNGTAARFTSTGDGNYFTPPGSYSTLVDGPAGSGYKTLTLQDGEEQRLDSTTGRLLQTKNALGRATTYEYAPGGQVSKITDPDGRSFEYTYSSSNGKLSQIKDFNGNQWNYEYTGDLLTKMVTPETSSDAVRATYSMSYDPSTKQLTGVTSPDGVTTTLTYGADRRVRSVSSSEGDSVSLTSGESQILPTGGTNTAVNASTVATSYTDAAGKVHTVVTNSFGRVTQETDAAGRVTTYTYNANGQVASQTDPDPDGVGPLSAPLTSYSYDSVGRVTLKTSPGGVVESWTYDVTNLKRRDPLTYTDPRSGVTTYTYDSATGNLLTETDPLGRTTTYTYYSAGAKTGLLYQVSTPDPDGAGPRTVETTTYDYFDNRQVKTITSPDSTTRQYTYDSRLHVATFTDELGQVTLYTNDAYGNVLTMTQPDPDGAGALPAPIYTYTYDGAGRLKTATNIEGVVTSYLYVVINGQDLVAQVLTQYPLAGGGTQSLVEYREYNALGLMTSEVDTMGNTTTYEYDSVTSRLLTKVTLPDPDGPTGPGQSNVTTYTYDALGRQVSTTEGVGTALARTSSVTYGENGMVASSTDMLGHITTMTYDSAGNLLSSTQNDPDGAGPLVSLSSSFTYDAGNRLSATTDGGGRTTAYTYYQDGNVDTVTYPDPDGAGPLTAPVVRSVFDSTGNIVQFTDRLGLITRYEYTATGLLQKTTAPSGIETTVSYDALGRKTQGVDEEGRTTTYAYNSLGQLASTTDYLSNVTSYTYDGLGRLLKVTFPDPDGLSGPGQSKRTEYLYNNDGTVASESDFSGTDLIAIRTTNYIYDRNGSLISVVDPLGHATQYRYDVFGRTVSIIDPLLHSTSMTYDALNHVVSTTDATGYTITNSYDGFGRLTATSRPGVGTQRLSYDAVGNILSKTDEEGRVTSFEYDDLDQPLAMIDASGGQTTSQYDSNGLLLSTTDPNGNTIYMEYDSLGRLARRGKDLVNNIEVESFNYSSTGLLITFTDTLGRTTVYTYDHGRLTDKQDPLEGLTRYVYDNLGRVIKVKGRSFPNGDDPVFVEISEYEYDVLGRLRFSIVPGRGETTNIYDVADRLISSDVEGRTSTYTYDIANRLITASDPMGRETDYTYDAANRLLTTTDALNHSQSTVYTPDGRVAETHDSLAGVTYFTYTATGNLASVKDPANNLTSYEYDGANRVTKETTTDGARTYEYDSAGNLTSATDRLGRKRTFTYQFDFYGTGFYQQTHELWWDGTTVVNDLVSVYDASSRKLSEGDNDSLYVYDYNSLSQLTFVRSDVSEKLSDSSAVGFSYEYDIHGNLNYAAVYQQGTDPVGRNGTSFEYVNKYAYGYGGGLMLITQIAANAPGNHVTDKQVKFSYDMAGRLMQIERMFYDAPVSPYLTTKFTYNADDEIVGMTHSNVINTYDGVWHETVQQLRAYSWIYDAAGRTQSTSGPDGTTVYSYDDTNQLTGADHSYQSDETYTYDANGNRVGGGYSTGAFNRITSDGTYNYTYDAEGHRISRTTIATGAYVAYTWDYRQRLSGVQFKTSSTGTITKTISYTYDVHNRLIIKQLDVNGDGSFDETERSVYDGSNIALTMDGTDQVTHYYLNGPGADLVFADETILGDVLWSLTDNQGTVRDWADLDTVAGVTTIVDHLSYDSYGNIMSQSDPSHEIGRAYTGQEWDVDVGLYYYRARWYDPQVGRFISEDPIGFVGGDANLTRYVGNSPTNLTDPEGLWGEPNGSTVPFGSKFHLDPFAELKLEQQRQLEMRRRLDEFFSNPLATYSVFRDPASSVDIIVRRFGTDDQDPLRIQRAKAYEDAFNAGVGPWSTRIAHVYLRIKTADGNVRTYSFHPNEWPESDNLAPLYRIDKQLINIFDPNRERPGRLWGQDPVDMNPGGQTIPLSHQVIRVSIKEEEAQRLIAAIESWRKQNGVGYDVGPMIADPGNSMNDIGYQQHIEPTGKVTYNLYNQNCANFAVNMVRGAAIPISDDALLELSKFNSGYGVARARQSNEEFAEMLRRRMTPVNDLVIRPADLIILRPLKTQAANGALSAYQTIPADILRLLLDPSMYLLGPSLWF